MRRAANTDNNHAETVKYLRSLSMSVQPLASVGSGVPDLLVGFRGVNVLIEMKDGEKVPSKRVLTADQEQWHAKWAGQVHVANDKEAAARVVIEVVGKAGRL